MAVDKFGNEIPENNKNYVVPVNEQETCVNWQRRGDYLEIWTSDKTVMNKLDKLVGNGHWEIVENCSWYKKYKCDNIKAFSFRTGEKRRAKSNEG